MPRVFKTIVPRVRKSLRDQGVARSLLRSVLLPVHLIREYRASRKLRPDAHKSEFDQLNSVETDGEFGGWTYLSDLNIKSPNWLDANDYLPIDPARFAAVLGALDVSFHDCTFVDFGSGKGRALLLASEFPFKGIIGLEFSPELHEIAERNIGKYRTPTQQCKDIRSVNIDFATFDLPRGPLVLFFFDPCRRHVLNQVLLRIKNALISRPDPVYVAYVAPRLETETILGSAEFLKEIVRNNDHQFVIYRGAQ